MKKIHLLTLICTILMAISCTKPKNNGDLSIAIGYSANGKPLITDTLCYVNEAGNTFMVTEIQWFISHLTLQDEQGEWREVSYRDATNEATNRIFYIDTNIPESQTLHTNPLPCGHYQALRFTFGLNEEDNRTGLFGDAPEANMFWPELLGSGYHYMKLNGRFVNIDNEVAPLNIHLGIGQNGDQGAFCQNYFTVELPIDVTVRENTENQLDITMIVDNWFRSPNLYDFNEFGSAIMQNQNAQQMLKENGNDVFSTEQLEIQNGMKTKEQKSLWQTCQDFIHQGAPKPHFWQWENVKQTVESIRNDWKQKS